MKKLLAILLAALMLSSALLMTSCGLLDELNSYEITDTKAQTKAQTQNQNPTGTPGTSGTGDNGNGTEGDGTTDSGSTNQNTPIKLGNILVGDMDGDGDIDDFDVYVQEWGDYPEMNNDGIRTQEDVLYDGEMPLSLWKNILDQYRKEYNKK